WTEEEKSLPHFMLALALGFRHIAEATGRTPGTVRCRTSRKRILPDVDVQPLDLRAADEREWTEDEETLLDVLATRGLAPARIALMLRRTKPTVIWRMQQLGLVGKEGSESVKRIATALRICICCRREFRSEGAHHRICDSCKGSLDDW